MAVGRGAGAAWLAVPGLRGGQLEERAGGLQTCSPPLDARQSNPNI